MKSVLFICTHNSARSQMAEAFVNHLCSDRYRAESAGTLATQVNPYAIAVMEEIGISMEGHRSKSIEEFRDRTFDVVITVCDNAKEACPFFPGKRVIHKGFRDPSGFIGSDDERMKEFRKVRDEIRSWILNEFCKGNTEATSPALTIKNEEPNRSKLRGIFIGSLTIAIE